MEKFGFDADWTLIVDTDEFITPKLRGEIETLCTRNAAEVPEAGFYLNRRLIFMDRLIRYCGYFPVWILRLFKRGRAVYEIRRVREHMLVGGPTDYVDSPMGHWVRGGRPRNGSPPEVEVASRASCGPP